ncbi:hypothetical protein HDU77_009078 [Chytriomyces hyalinus]|nr:hypothetical protein HDU77_009078 [Chytriomyces hyalinus]
MEAKPRRKKARTAPMSKFGSLKSHPFGVQPMGNSFLAPGPNQRPPADRRGGLGAIAVLTDEVLMTVLLCNTDAVNESLVFRLMRCSRALYVLCNTDAVWRDRCIARFGGGFGAFSDSWKNTYKAALFASLSVKEKEGIVFVPDVPIKVGFFSDYLFSSWRCSTVPLNALCRSNAPDNIDRRCNLSMECFIEEYDKPGKPVILTDVVTKWPAFKKWSMDYLEKTVGDTIFRAESVDLPFKSYAAYAKHCRENGGSFEEAPLYLFDKYFSHRTSLADDYTVPEYFSEDLFQVLGAEKRPDYRWIIIGPPRSGSTFHLDPNSTSAWNAVITGSKKWLLFPPDCIPPGVFPSVDGSEVTTPISLAEWFLNHYDEIKHWPVKPVECICRAGEVLYVPRGWWHCVMNLEESIAITQNFVNTVNLASVLRFCRTKPEQVSGYGSGCLGEELGATLYNRFKSALASTHQHVIDEELELAQHASRILPNDKEEDDKKKLASLFGKKPALSALAGLCAADDADAGSSFRFSF